MVFFVRLVHEAQRDKPFAPDDRVMEERQLEPMDYEEAREIFGG